MQIKNFPLQSSSSEDAVAKPSANPQPDKKRKRSGPEDEWLQKFTKTFFECLDKATIKGFVLTHLDLDHKNLVNTILDNSRREGKLDEKSFFIYSINPRAEGYRHPHLVGGEKVEELMPFPGEYEDQIKSLQTWLNDLFSKPDNPASFNFLKANWATFSFSGKNDNNDISLVFSLEHQGIKVLFTGDSSGNALDNYIGEDENSKYHIENRRIIAGTHVFVVPHHGSEAPWCWRWTLNVVKNSPDLRIAIINVDPTISPYDHPQAWIADVPWPASMKGEEHDIHYRRSKTNPRTLSTDENVFTTGKHSEEGFIKISIKDNAIYKDDKLLEKLPSSRTSSHPRQSVAGPHR